MCVCIILYYRKCKDSLNNVQNMKEEEFVFFDRCKYFLLFIDASTGMRRDLYDRRRADNLILFFTHE